jgi:hypothetical protein
MQIERYFFLLFISGMSARVFLLSLSSGRLEQSATSKEPLLLGIQSWEKI